MKQFPPVRRLLAHRHAVTQLHSRQSQSDTAATAVRYDCAVVGAFKYPAGDASANRLLSLAKTFSASGRTPLVINDAPVNPHVRPSGRSAGSYHGIDYICLEQGRDSRAGRLVHRCTRPIRLLKALHALGPRASHIRWISVASGLYTPGVHCVLHFAAGKRTISDIVERHDPQQFQRGSFDVRLWRHRWTSWLSGRLADRVVVISSALEQRLSVRRAVLVLPPAVDSTEYQPRTARDDSSDRLTLLYLGTPSNKDLLGVLLTAIQKLDAAEQRRLQVIIAGPSRDDLIANVDVGGRLLAAADQFIDILGPVPRHRVYELLAAADFTFLLRSPGGYATAGFPSKIPESLAAGCPVIVNLTSDLGRYLKPGTDSLICASAGIDDVLQTLHRVLELSRADLLRMSAEARETAVQHFDYHAWASALDSYLRMGAT